MNKPQTTGRPSFTLTVRGVGGAIVVLEAALKVAQTATETVTANPNAAPERSIALPNKPAMLELRAVAEEMATDGEQTTAIDDLIVWSESGSFVAGATIVPGIEAAIAAAQALAARLAEKAAAAEAEAKLYDSLLKRQIDGVASQKALRERARTEKVEGYLPSDWIRFPTPQRNALKGSAKEMEAAEATLAKDVAVVDVLVLMRAATLRLNETARKGHAHNVPFGSVIAEPDGRKVARDTSVGKAYIAEVDARIARLLAEIVVAEEKIAATKAAFQAQIDAVFARIQVVAGRGFRGDIVRTKREDITRGNMAKLVAELAILEKNMGIGAKPAPVAAAKPAPAAPAAKTTPVAAKEPEAPKAAEPVADAVSVKQVESELNRVNGLIGRYNLVERKRDLETIMERAGGNATKALRAVHELELFYLGRVSGRNKPLVEARIAEVNTLLGRGKRPSSPAPATTTPPPAAPATVAATPAAAPTPATSIAA